MIKSFFPEGKILQFKIKFEKNLTGR